VRLNGWQRIGIILSICWAVGAAWYELGAIGDREQSAIHWRVTPLYDQCRDAQDRAITSSQSFNRDCVNESKENLEKAIKEELGRETRLSVAIAAFAPIALAWLLAYVLLVTWHWIGRGFNSN
jgi:hypothetical protein